MSTLYLPDSWATISADSSTGFFNSSGNSSNAMISGGSVDAGVSLLLIYTGSIASFPSFTDASSRSADLLITFSLPGASQAFQNLGYTGNNLRLILGKNPVATTATGTGTATWFLLCRAGNDLTTRGAMIGNIGTTGSNADLVIANTSIQSGQTYTSSGIYVNIPLQWNV